MAGPTSGQLSSETLAVRPVFRHCSNVGVERATGHRNHTAGLRLLVIVIGTPCPLRTTRLAVSARSLPRAPAGRSQNRWGLVGGVPARPADLVLEMLFSLSRDVPDWPLRLEAGDALACCCHSASIGPGIETCSENIIKIGGRAIIASVLVPLGNGDAQVENEIISLTAQIVPAHGVANDVPPCSTPRSSLMKSNPAITV